MNTLNEVFFGEKGITSTSANYLANLAQEIITEDTALLDKMSFVSTSIDIIGSEAQSKDLKIGVDSEFINSIPERISRIASMNAFCAWTREAIKAKEIEMQYISNIDMSEWAEVIGIEVPEYPRMYTQISDTDIISEMSIKERNEYYFLEAQAASIGKYIHQKGTYNMARKSMYERIANPITKEGTGKDTILYYHKSSVEPALVDSVFQQLQNKHREYEQRLNAIKYNIKEKARARNVELSARYKKEYEEVTLKRAELQNEFYDWKREALAKISKLKIIIPNELVDTFNYLNSLGK